MWWLIVELIEENAKQVYTLDSIGDETAEVELVEKLAALKARLTAQLQIPARAHVVLELWC